MLGDRGPAQLELIGKIAGGTRPVGEQPQQPAPHRVGERQKHVILSHAEKNTSETPDMSTISDALCGTTAVVGAVKPWHLALLSFCCLGTTAVIAGVALLFIRRRRS
ncbi:hypothetical protein GCM10009687_37500 [Asanoa iriomotensis]